MKLIIELVPQSSWYDNVRSQVNQATWDLLRKNCYKKAKHRCEICRLTGLVQGYGHPVECHEIWEYDDKRYIQKLTGLISLCPWCHKVKHAGRTIHVEGNYSLVVKQLMKVNQITQLSAERHISQAFKQWQDRSQFSWTVDTSILNGLISDAKQNLCPITY